MVYMIHKNITIEEKHDKWLNSNHIKLSGFIRKKIEEEINK